MSLFSRTPKSGDEELPTRAKAYNAPRPIISSAARINLSSKTDIELVTQQRKNSKWQEDAWEYYDLVGEIKFAANLLANNASRVRLYPAFIVDKDAIPSIIDDVEGLDPELITKANEALQLLATGNGGISGLLRDAALNLFVTGECFLAKEPAKISTGEPERWQIRSTSEMITVAVSGPEYQQSNGQAMAIKQSKSSTPEEYIVLPPRAFVGRIWRTHPRFSADADSSILGILELLDELLSINKSARTVTRSRLNSGLLYIPDEIDNIAQTDGEFFDDDGEEIAGGANDNVMSIEEELQQAILEPISDEGSASAAVPTILRGPAAYSENIRLIKFERSFDPAIIQRGERVLDRILSALDLPKDVVKGIADIKYSNAIIVSEDLYNSHIEPLILMIVDALTVVFLRPVLRGLNFPEEVVSRVTLWYDSSAITAKPDKGTAATEGHSSGLVSAAAWRREHGFSETDAPTQLEIAQGMAVSKGLLSEPITEALLKTLIPDILEKVRQESLDISDPGSVEALSSVLDSPATAEPASDTMNSEQEQATEAPTELIEP